MEKEKVLKVREDLNEMVKSIGMKLEDGRYGRQSICVVKLFNGEVINFVDKNCALYDLLNSYVKLGGKDYIKSKKMEERIKNQKVDTVDDDIGDDGLSTYICVVYTLEDGTEQFLFPSRKFTDRKIIDNYYKLFKKQKQENKGVTSGK